MDALQNKIRKGKNPLAVDLSVFLGNIPDGLLAEHGGVCGAWAAFCRELLAALKGTVPAVRFGFSSYALLGPEGLSMLSELLRKSAALGYYVLLDAPELTSSASAQMAASAFWGEEGLYPCDGLIVPCYCGSDVIKPFLPYCKEQKKDLFVSVRTPNKSASELQDLLTGTRLVHAAAADYVNRFADDTVGKYGYSRIAVLASATSAESLKALRSKYPKLFILVDGMDCVGANAKNCAGAFDKFGHGAICCAGSSVTGAWKKSDSDNFAAAAAADAERLMKNLSRYITVL